MLLQIKSQGFPEILTDLGIQSPLQGPFWGFESTVLPIVDVQKNTVRPLATTPYDGFASAGVLATPAAGAFLAQTNAVLFRGAWAIQANVAWVNTSATNAFVLFERYNDTFTLALESQPIATIGSTTDAEGKVGQVTREFVLQKASFGQPWALTVSNALATAGSVVWGSLRIRYLGEISGPAGFNP